IADEPTTALDVTVQAQILDLIRDLQKEFNSAVIIITHDLGVVAELADDILVMYAGRAVEYGTAEHIFNEPEHPYTWGLLGSMPRFDRDRSERLVPIKGTPPSLINVPPGCPFHPRCRFEKNTDGLSQRERPELIDNGQGHLVACHMPSACISGATSSRRCSERASRPPRPPAHRDGKDEPHDDSHRDHRGHRPARARGPAHGHRPGPALPDPQGADAATGGRRAGRRRHRLHGQARRDPVPG